MKRPVFVSPQEAASMIESNSTVATIGMTLVSASESILKAIEQRYLEEKAPNGLTLVHSCGQSDRDRGIQHFAHEGMLKRIIGGHSSRAVCAVIPFHGWRRTGEDNKGGAWNLCGSQAGRRQDERAYQVGS